MTKSEKRVATWRQTADMYHRAESELREKIGNCLFVFCCSVVPGCCLVGSCTGRHSSVKVHLPFLCDEVSRATLARPANICGFLSVAVTINRAVHCGYCNF